MKLPIPVDSDFPIHNIPFGIYSTKTKSKRVGVAIGDHILDLSILADSGAFGDMETSVFTKPYLNDFIRLGKSKTNGVRLKIQDMLRTDSLILTNSKNLIDKQSEAEMHLPVRVGDYTDFYSSIEHATNVGTMFRGPENALKPNWRHLPVGYHGRASSIIPSGIPIHRPKGQVLPKGADAPVFQPTTRLDFELETAFIIGRDSALGSPIATDDATNYIFGMVLFNDWSARDIQAWEYVPLGPFLGKNFASSVSPWVVTMEALEPFKVAGPKQEPEVLPYLKFSGNKNYNINLEVSIQPESGEETIVCKSNFQYMYWNMQQQLAHHTVNGCNVHVGDMIGSGTISGTDERSYGSMLELSWAGSKKVPLKDGSERVFLENGDTVTMTGAAEKDRLKVGFGSVSTKILPAK